MQRKLLKQLKSLSLFFFIFIFCSLGVSAETYFPPEDSSFSSVTINYEGRFRSLDVASSRWLETFSKQKSLTPWKSKLPKGLNKPWQLYSSLFMFGTSPFEKVDFFYLSPELINYLELEKREKPYYSAKDLNVLLNRSNSSKKAVTKLIQASLFDLRDPTPSTVLMGEAPSKLHPQLSFKLKNNQLVVGSVPKEKPWSILKVNEELDIDLDSSLQLDPLAEELDSLYASLLHFGSFNQLPHLQQDELEEWVKLTRSHGMSNSEIAQELNTKLPTKERLRQIPEEGLMLPSKNNPLVWVNLHTLSIKEIDPITGQWSLITNYTDFDGSSFKKIQAAYQNLIHHPEEGRWEPLAKELNHAYETHYPEFKLSAHKKEMRAPTPFQLKVESLYHHLPLLSLSLIFYLIAAILYRLSSQRRLPALFDIPFYSAYCLHTLALIMRIYVLQRPPVSNMLETVLYVPWVAVTASLFSSVLSVPRLIKPISSFLASIFLALLVFSGPTPGMDNVQAVLDSQFWLMIHVLMVVGSYGFFILAGLVAHCYLVMKLFKKSKLKSLTSIESLLSKMVYAGAILLIPGTILGGVWAAQSWGRFWDWDPKESWAFISSCYYLIAIHLYRFRHIKGSGLALLSIAGLMVISFTWYGVNYILGVGLHSYGFGSGGEFTYFSYLIVQSIILIFFIAFCLKGRYELDKK